MSHNPEDIGSRQFSVQLRGWSKREVSEFLDEVAADYRTMRSRAETAEARLEESRSRLESLEGVLRSAKEAYLAVQARVAELEAERDTVRSESGDIEIDAATALGEEVTEILRDAVAASRSIRDEAEYWSSARPREADDEATDRLESAGRNAEAIVAEAETTVAHLRTVEQSVRGWLESLIQSVAQSLDEAGSNTELGTWLAPKQLDDPRSATTEEPPAADPWQPPALHSAQVVVPPMSEQIDLRDSETSSEASSQY